MAMIRGPVDGWTGRFANGERDLEREENGEWGDLRRGPPAFDTSENAGVGRIRNSGKAIDLLGA